MYKHKVSFGELMQMDSTTLYALYRSAWKLSVEKAKEAEEQARQQAEEEKQAKRGGNNQSMGPTARQKMTQALAGMSHEDLQDMLEGI